MKFWKFAQILLETSSTILQYFLIRVSDIYGGGISHRTGNQKKEEL